MIRQAVIMAAGLGSRLKERTAAMPKGFLEFDGVPIIEMSVRKLIAAGIEEIVIGTGHCSEAFDALSRRYGCITLVKNEEYASTGSMYTLSRCAERIRGDFLLLESDLIYDSIGLRVLINDPHRDVVLASGATNSGDEVYLECDEGHFLRGNSKRREELGSVYGELVGISKLTKDTVRKMIEHMVRNMGSAPKMDYEAALSYVSSRCSPVFVRKVEFYTWCEIDDESHLERARKAVYPHVRENEEIRRVRREVLLNPGPATTTDSVKEAQVQTDICPREHEFGDVMEWVADELALMVGAPGRVKAVLFGGSGTAGDEVMISSCIPDGSRTLIVNNGAYGKRLARIADIYGLEYDEFESDGTQPLDAEAVKRRISSGGYTHLVIVYHETTTGLLNPVPEICRHCKANGVTTIVDAVSAFCAVPIDMDEDGIDFMSSTSNKNIQGMAGLAFVFCRTEALESIKPYPMRNYYLNLYDQHAYFERTHQTRFTPPVQTYYALRQAIIEAKVETIESRYSRYTACWRILIEGLERLGLRYLVPIEAQSRLIVTVCNPESERYDFETMHDFMRDNGFTIYPGKLSDHPTFRIANIGDIQPEEMSRFIDLLKTYLDEING
ncbi:MAG: 2-aminoethylphosphonate--pyruvate transaminase [Thermoplasmata archaeon]|jgi:2-aminoethylphosphonate-pyruvate transaminase|nr:2-aminoethylphosphonate--pyruvate transaminase [Thermoplasmata archaeon]